MGEAILARASDGGGDSGIEFEVIVTTLNGGSTLKTVTFSRSLAKVKGFIMMFGNTSNYVSGSAFDAEGNRVLSFGNNSKATMTLNITGDNTISAAVSSGYSGNIYTGIAAIF